METRRGEVGRTGWGREEGEKERRRAADGGAGRKGREAWRKPRGGRNFGQPLAGSAGCPRPTPGHHAPLGATACGGRFYPELASGMGKFGLARTPLQDLAFPAGRALPPSAERWTGAILQGEREGVGERSGEIWQ